MGEHRRGHITTKKQAARLQVPRGSTWREFLKRLATNEGTVEGVCDALGVTRNTAIKWYAIERLELGARVVCIDLDEEARARFEAEQAAGRELVGA